MPAPSTADDLLSLLRESGVIDQGRLGEFLGQWPEPGEMPADPRDLAEVMLKSGLITSFQKDQFLLGKHRGFIIADKFILLDHLGAGGMGSVYLCEHRVMRRRVAIKVLPKDFAKDPEYLERFHREARAAAALDHPNIVRAHDADHDGDMHFLVMEYIEGSSMHELVKKEGPLDIVRAADYIAQAACGLEHAHESGLVHRDIKPANLLVDRKGTVKILDMGLAMFFQDRESLTKQYDANAVLGTADYLAPEQAIDSHGVDIRADIYSLGLTFYFLLTAKNPYSEGTIAQKLLWHQMREIKSVRDTRPEVPEGLAAILSKMIAKDKLLRYQTPREVADALTPWIRGTTAAVTERIPSSAGVPAPPASTASMRKDMTVEEPKPAEASSAGLTKKSTGSSPRTEVKPRPEKTLAGANRPRKAKVTVDPEPKTPPGGKSVRTPAKRRGGKNSAEGYWSTKRITWTSSIVGLLLLLGIGRSALGQATTVG